MKNLIITIGIVMLVLSGLSLQFKCNEMLYRKTQMKMAADEGAATAALMIDKEAYKRGELKLDTEGGKKKADDVIENNMGRIQVTTSYTYGYTDDNNPWVTVILEFNGMKASSQYEYIT